MLRRSVAFLAIFLGCFSTTCMGDILEITEDTILDPSIIYDGLIIKASNITIDGRGAWIIGEKQGTPKEFSGIGISAKGVDNVRLLDVNVKGFETGLQIEDAKGWVVEDCSFSDNFHDPNFGWGENGIRGGIVLRRVENSRFARNKANRVWDACALIESNYNVLEGNDFSRTSNTCLKMWTASNNRIENNNLSYGIRKNPGEVHARDSAGVLMESGSNFNRFLRNNCRYGGDGIFIRVLNGWVSTDNYFEENDCSYANNNCFEAWSPRNTYVRNKANHGSYGFWLGASDQTKLIDNEASYNGLPTGNHNSPHLPENKFAGIVFMFGSSSHTICRGNICKGNIGAGIAAIGDEKKPARFRAFHWIVEDNQLSDNQWGLYVTRADWIRVAGNQIQDNKFNIHTEDVHEVTINLNAPAKNKASIPVANLLAAKQVSVGQVVTFDASGSTNPESEQPLNYKWCLDNGVFKEGSKVEHTYQQPGFYRVGLTVDNRQSADLTWLDLYVVDATADESMSESNVDAWGWKDPKSIVTFHKDAMAIAGATSIGVDIDPYGGGLVELVYPKSRDAGIPFDSKHQLSFWVKSINPNLNGWQNNNPVVTLYQDDQNYVRLSPVDNLLGKSEHNEAREGWSLFNVPLSGNEKWKVEKVGTPSTINFLSIGVDSWGGDPLKIWIDGMSWK